MPLSVDPILVFPLAASDAASIARCVGRIRCAFFEISSLPCTSTPSASRPAISSERMTGSITTPLPMTLTEPSRKMPEGIVCSTYLLALEVEGVPCVRAALEPGDHPVGGSEHVHDFPFSLVAPLQA